MKGFCSCEFYPVWWNCKLMYHYKKQSGDYPPPKKKTKNSSTIRVNNSTSGYLSEENENTNSKRYIHPYVNFSIICNR